VAATAVGAAARAIPIANSQPRSSLPDSLLSSFVGLRG
jgi:hypothetical protein